MTEQQGPRPPHRRLAVLAIAVLVVLIAGGTVAGVVASRPQQRTDAGATSPVPTPDPSPSPSAPSSAPPSASASATSRASTPVPSKRASAVAPAPKPQPTRTATLSKPATIAKALTATVTGHTAVNGRANGPGEIAGPSVRFTITIRNTTGKAVDLSSTVVNAYYGSAATPAQQLEAPGGRNFPVHLANGATATGAFVFTIPRSDRTDVEVTVDTAVANPVVAFRGSAA